ncbi:MAG: beta-glucosidase [Ruminococcaceae bacterium]|nr:beta-glucosidase [Oscillospiraceae bacterium]
MIYKDATKTPEQRAEDLLSRMTLHEKVGQLIMQQGTSWHESDGKNITITDEIRQKLAKGTVGNVYGLLRSDWWTGKSLETGIQPKTAAKIVNELQKTAMSSRLGIPLLVCEEGPHGLMALGATVFPTGMGQASSFDRELIKEMGAAVAVEARSMGANVTYGPILDVARDPRWSRVEEGYGEEPYLTSELGVAQVQGLQGGTAVKKIDGEHVVSTLKHFAAHGEPEGGHNSAPTHVGERELHDVHLYAFKKCIEAGAMSIMSSYNEIDGAPCTGSKKLFTEILRDQWGFDGFAVSDAGAIPGLLNAQRVAESYDKAMAMALDAGVDTELCTDLFETSLEKAVLDGIVPIADVDKCVLNVLKTKFRLGLFENPYIDENAWVNVNCEKHKALAEKMAQKALVLLKNDGQTLPLSAPKRIAVIGPNANMPLNQLGDYTAPQPTGKIQTVLKGVKDRFAESEIKYAKGCSIRNLDESGFDEAIEAAKQSDVIIYVMGGSSAADSETGFLENGAARIDEIKNDSKFDKDSGEGYDRAYLSYAGVQTKLLEKLSMLEKPVVTVLIQGRPLIMTQVMQYSSAVILAWYPGEMGGRAVASAIAGDFSPSGRLPISVPDHEGQLPVYYNTSALKNPYIDLVNRPKFRFGYGLSYTSFKYENFRADKVEMTEDEQIKLYVDVTNTGERDSDEVTLLFMRDLFASVTRPRIMLRGFERTFIKAGETKTVSFEINRESLAFHDINMNYTAEKGEFEFLVGGDLDCENKLIITLK